MRKLKFFQLCLVFILATILVACRVQFFTEPTSSEKCVLEIDNDDEAKFQELVGIREMNTDLKLVQRTDSFPLDFQIYNLSEEYIYFKDDTFSLSGYQFDFDNRVWVLKEIPIFSIESSPIRLNPGLDELDPAIMNEITLFQQTLNVLNVDHLRLLIRGKGQTTGLEYGAYTDLCIGLDESLP